MIRSIVLVVTYFVSVSALGSYASGSSDFALTCLSEKEKWTSTCSASCSAGTEATTPFTPTWYVSGGPKGPSKTTTLIDKFSLGGILKVPKGADGKWPDTVYRFFSAATDGSANPLTFEMVKLYFESGESCPVHFTYLFIAGTQPWGQGGMMNNWGHLHNGVYTPPTAAPGGVENSADVVHQTTWQSVPSPFWDNDKNVACQYDPTNPDHVLPEITQLSVFAGSDQWIRRRTIGIISIPLLSALIENIGGTYIQDLSFETAARPPIDDYIESMWDYYGGLLKRELLPAKGQAQTTQEFTDQFDIWLRTVANEIRDEYNLPHVQYDKSSTNVWSNPGSLASIIG